MDAVQDFVLKLWNTPPGVSEVGLFLTQFEKDFYPEPEPFTWMRENPQLPVIAVTIYFLFVHLVPIFYPPVGRDAPKSKIREFIKNLEMIWNLGLAAFSLIGLLRVAPRLISNLRIFGLHYSVCSVALHSFGAGPSGFWVLAFILSKFVELGDTVFLILQRKKVLFLHWYHHITVLLFCWHSFVTKSGNGIWFASMNLFVHTLMYWYFFLTGMGYRPKWNMPLTILQISQMFVGIAITLLAVHYHYRHEAGELPPCSVEKTNIAAGLLMYFSYFILFCHFFYGRYLAGGKKPAAPRAASAPAVAGKGADAVAPLPGAKKASKH